MRERLLQEPRAWRFRRFRVVASLPRTLKAPSCGRPRTLCVLPRLWSEDFPLLLGSLRALVWGGHTDVGIQLCGRLGNFNI